MTQQVTLRINSEIVDSLAQTLSTNNSTKRVGESFTWLDGSGAAQASKNWSPLTQYSVAQSVNTDIDLSGALAGTYGTVVFTAIKGLIIKAGASNPGNLVVGNVTNGIVGFFGAATHSIAVQPGGIFVIATPGASGYGITAATADLLRVASAATAGTYTFDILVWGI